MAREKIKYLEISYPNFVLGAIIDPDEANQNNYDIVTKVNEFVDEVEEALDVADRAEVKSDTAILDSTEALEKANVAKPLAEDAIVKADAVFAIKPDLDQAIIDANDVVTRIDDIIDGVIFSSVGARTLEGNFVSLVDGIVTFSIPTPIYNPVTDYIEFIYMGVILEKDVNYTQNGRQITLLFPLEMDEEIRYKSIKNIMIDPTLSDGALIKNSTITDDKLDDGEGQIKDRVKDLPLQMLENSKQHLQIKSNVKYIELKLSEASILPFLNKTGIGFYDLFADTSNIDIVNTTASVSDNSVSFVDSKKLKMKEETFNNFNNLELNIYDGERVMFNVMESSVDNTVKVLATPGSISVGDKFYYNGNVYTVSEVQ